MKFPDKGLPAWISSAEDPASVPSWYVKNLGTDQIENRIKKLLDGDEASFEVKIPEKFRNCNVPYFVERWRNSKLKHKELVGVQFLQKGKESAPPAAWPTFEDNDRPLMSSVQVDELAEDPNLETDQHAATNVISAYAEVVVVLALWRVLAHISKYGNGERFPDEAAYVPKRAVDMDPGRVHYALRDAGLYFPWNIIEAACTALNVGKHLILTGPPGCGKTKLATFLADVACRDRPEDVKAIIATASPAWTTGDLIGRYMPDVSDRTQTFQLKFRPGLFLKAAKANTWLIIDEMNRADIDKCFGELFTVLAGGTVTLPFEAISDDSAENDTALSDIVVGPAESEDATTRDAEYQMKSFFRLIGTMNDADRSGLNQLSFALQRRFVMIRVEAPPEETIKKFIGELLERLWKETFVEGGVMPYKFGAAETPFQKMDLKTGKVWDALVNLFAKEKGENDLVNARLVGMATVKDVVHFLVESVRAPYQVSDSVTLPKGKTHTSTHKHNYLMSELALAIVLHVFPQLDVYIQTDDKKQFEKVLTRLRRAFNGSDMYYVKSGEKGLAFENADRSVWEYFQHELKLQFAQYHDYVQLIQDVPEPSSSDEPGESDKDAAT